VRAAGDHPPDIPRKRSRRRVLLAVSGDLIDVVPAVARSLERFAPLPTGVRITVTITEGQSLAHRRRCARNHMLQQIAGQHFADLDFGRAAEELARGIRRYASGQWLHDRRRKAVPAECPSNSLRAQLFDVFQLGAVPGSPKQIRRILKPLSLRGNTGTSEATLQCPSASRSLDPG
jgi:hypothetical protein